MGTNLREGLLIGSLREHRRRHRELATKCDGAYSAQPARGYCEILARTHRAAADCFDKELRALEEDPPPARRDAEGATMSKGERPKPPYVKITDSKGYHPTCFQCDRKMDIVVVVGEVDDWDSGTARLCLDCLDKARAELVRQLARR